MTDTYRDVDIPLMRLSGPYRQRLDAQADRLNEQIDAFDEQLDKVYEEALPKLEALEAKMPDLGEATPTAVQYLTRRAARADLDIAIYTRDVAAGEVRVKCAKAVAERDDLDVRRGQVDHLAEDGDPVLSPGNDDLLAIWMLAAHESAIELATAETCLQFARRRLEHAKKAQREVREALRAQKRAEEQAAKK